MEKQLHLCASKDQMNETMRDVKNLQNTTNNHRDELDDLKNRLDKMFGPSMDQFNLLKSRVDMLEGAN